MNILAISNLAFYKEMVTSVTDLAAFTQTSKLLVYYSMVGKGGLEAKTYQFF